MPSCATRTAVAHRLEASCASISAPSSLSSTTRTLRTGCASSRFRALSAGTALAASAAEAEIERQIDDELAARAGPGALRAHGAAVGGRRGSSRWRGRVRGRLRNGRGTAAAARTDRTRDRATRPGSRSRDPARGSRRGRRRTSPIRWTGSRIAVLGSVRQQVREHLLEARRVAVDEEVVRNVEVERLSAAARAAGCVVSTARRHDLARSRPAPCGARSSRG